MAEVVECGSRIRREFERIDDLLVRVLVFFLFFFLLFFGSPCRSMAFGLMLLSVFPVLALMWLVFRLRGFRHDSSLVYDLTRLRGMLFYLCIFAMTKLCGPLLAGAGEAAGGEAAAGAAGGAAEGGAASGLGSKMWSQAGSSGGQLVQSAAHGIAGAIGTGPNYEQVNIGSISHAT